MSVLGIVQSKDPSLECSRRMIIAEMTVDWLPKWTRTCWPMEMSNNIRWATYSLALLYRETRMISLNETIARMCQSSTVATVLLSMVIFLLKLLSYCQLVGKHPEKSKLLKLLQQQCIGGPQCCLLISITHSCTKLCLVQSYHFVSLLRASQLKGVLLFSFSSFTLATALGM